MKRSPSNTVRTYCFVAPMFSSARLPPSLIFSRASLLTSASCFSFVRLLKHSSQLTDKPVSSGRFSRRQNADPSTFPSVRTLVGFAYRRHDYRRSYLQKCLKFEGSHLPLNTIQSVSSSHTRYLIASFSSPEDYILQHAVPEKLKSKVIAIQIVPDDAQIAVVQEHYFCLASEGHRYDK